MKILITSGGTREYIDEVRVLTNISTGNLGREIANIFYLGSETEKIFYVCSKNSALPVYEPKEVIERRYADSTQDVYDVMEELVPQVDVVIHCMAVSDFSFKPSNTKLKSNDPQAFIDSLRDRIVVTPKILSHIKEWNPKVKLVSFKFEVGKTHADLIDIAYESLVKNNCDYVVANDKAEMVKANEHIAYIIDKNKKAVKCKGKSDISIKLYNKLTHTTN